MARATATDNDGNGNNNGNSRFGNRRCKKNGEEGAPPASTSLPPVTGGGGDGDGILPSDNDSALPPQRSYGAERS